MEHILNNLEKLLEKVKTACEKSGIPEESVAVVAATKTRSKDEIKALYESGKVAALGENRVQELLSKYDDSLVFDMIGQLQSNKVKYIIDKVRLIHSVDRVSLMEEIQKRAEKINKVQNILIEINLGEEENKGGVSIVDAKTLVMEAERFKNIKVKGFMALVPLESSMEERKVMFLQAKALFRSMKKENTEIEYLSMGMSDDFELAIECGANIIRPGSILFGARE